MSAKLITTLGLSALTLVVAGLGCLKSTQLFSVERDDSSPYTVEIWTEEPLLSFRLAPLSKWDLKTRVVVKDGNGQIIKVWNGGSLSTCEVLWGKDEIIVGDGLLDIP
jgi:hypothetical protein